MSLFRRATQRPENAPDQAAPPVTEVTLLLTDDRGRAALFEAAEASLPADEVLVQVRDVVGKRRSFATYPSDPRATLVAKESPLVLRGDLTALVSYYRVPAAALHGREEHYEGGKFSHAYDVTLRVVSRGRAGPVREAVVA